MSAVTQATLPSRPQQMVSDRIPFNIKNTTEDIFMHEITHTFSKHFQEVQRERENRSTEIKKESDKQK